MKSLPELRRIRRLYCKTVSFFFNGLHNYTDKRGQLYGRSRSDFNMATCFHIKKRGEM